MKNKISNDKRKKYNMEHYSELIRNLQIGWNEYRAIFPNDTLEDFISFIQQSGKYESKARTWLFTRYVDMVKPEGLSTQAIISQKMITIPPMELILNSWGAIMVLVDKLFKPRYSMEAFFIYPLANLFNRETESFELTPEFRADLDNFCMWNVKHPENERLLTDLTTTLNP
jgi:hypothetical protein